MGCARARRGEGRGDANGDGIDDFCREKLGLEAGKPDNGAGLEDAGGEPTGVGTLFTCHGAGDDLRMIVCRSGASVASPPFLRRQRTERMVFSSATPLREVSF